MNSDEQDKWILEDRITILNERIAELEAELARRDPFSLGATHWRADGHCHSEHEERKRYQAREVQLMKMRERLLTSDEWGYLGPDSSDIEEVFDQYHIPRRNTTKEKE